MPRRRGVEGENRRIVLSPGFEKTGLENTESDGEGPGLASKGGAEREKGVLDRKAGAGGNEGQGSGNTVKEQEKVWGPQVGSGGKKRSVKKRKKPLPQDFE